MLNYLVAYKGKYAKIVGENAGKFEIEIQGGKNAKVRVKDLRFLAPNFTIPNDNLEPDFTILNELEEELLSIEDLSNWIFNEYSASSSWQVFQLAEDGMHCYWQKDKIFIRLNKQVEKIKQKRDLELKEELLIQKFLQCIVAKTYHTSDLVFIKEIEKVALSQLKSSKILKKLAIPNTPQDAHKFLIDIGYLQLTTNPYPARNKIRLPQDLEVFQQEFARTDLTTFTSYAIDNTGSNDADDAIAISGDKIWISIADVASFIDAELLKYSEDRISNLYLPDQIISMLPEIITQKCALNKKSNALSIGFKLSENCENITDIEVVKSMAKIKNIDYDTVDKIIDDKFLKFHIVAKNHREYRKKSGSFNLDLPKVDVRLNTDKVELKEQLNSKSRLMVAEFMILAGRVISEFAVQNSIAIPFVSQEKGNFSDEILSQEKLSISESFASTKLFKRSKISTNPSLHFGLGLDKYTRVTSPLRRYLDLLTHYQLSNFIAKKPLLTVAEIKEKIGINNTNLQKINQTTKDSNNHYKFLYILQNKNEIFDGQIISNLGNKKLLMIIKLGMIQAIKTDKKLDETLKIKFNNIDIFNQELECKIVN